MGLRTWIYKKTGIKLRAFTRSRFANHFVDTDVQVGDHTYAQASGNIYRHTRIGRYCSMANNVSIGVFQHPVTWLSTHPFQYDRRLNPALKADTMPQPIADKSSKGLTQIGNDVWIGENAIIMTGITIGDGAIIGAGAVVTKDVPPYAIVVGVPARILRYRFDEPTIKQLLTLQWWELEPEEMDGVDFSDVHQAIAQITQIKRQRKYTQQVKYCVDDFRSQ